VDDVVGADVVGPAVGGGVTGEVAVVAVDFGNCSEANCNNSLS
jgi:hypothetical protein